VGPFRWLSPARVLRLAALLLLSAVAAVAQPLSQGYSLAGDRYFLDGEELRVLKDDGSLEKIETDLVGVPSKLVKPEGWGETLLVVGDQQVARLTPQGLSTLGFTESEETSEEAPRTQFALWGDKAVWFREGGRAIEWSGGEQAQTIQETEAIIYPLEVLDDRLLYLTADGQYKLHSASQSTQAVSGPLPFPSKEAKVATDDREFLIWSPTSTTVLRPGRESLELSQPPVLGVRALEGGGFILGSANSLVHLSGDEKTTFASPDLSGEEEFSGARFVLMDDSLYVLGRLDGAILTWRCTPSGVESGSILKEEEVKSLLQSGSAVLLLTETSLEETRVDDSGRVVKVPRTGKDATHSVKGYKLHRLEQGEWVEKVFEPRARVVGPVQLIGEQVVFATQTEPTNEAGASRTGDRRYPYPEVLLHAFSLQTGERSWTTDLDRGEAPSPARLPDGVQWPLLEESGPLLFTTENDRLTALDPETGEVLWSSDRLPMDESRPKMLKWEDSLGLVAVANTTRQFLLFDQQGRQLQSFRLNDIFNHARTLNLIGVVAICMALILYIYLAGKKKLFIRRIAGLEALDEAVGRSTEMGKPVLYVTGLADVDDIQTLAALSILSHVAKKTAEYDTPILATTSRAVTFSAAQEVVRDAYTIAGRPDSFSVESVRYISDDQFGYAAGVDGLMMREKPAANFYMGKFYAESLIFAETGNATGAIQIAGTAQANQLPFFVAACDYTLIGEELFAASAYLSGDPLQVGSLRGQDVGKAIVMVVLVVLSLDVTFGGRITTWLGTLIGGAA